MPKKSLQSDSYVRITVTKLVACRSIAQPTLGGYILCPNHQTEPYASESIYDLALLLTIKKHQQSKSLYSDELK